MKPSARQIIEDYNAGRITEVEAEKLSRQHYNCPLCELDEEADLEDEEEDVDIHPLYEGLYEEEEA